MITGNCNYCGKCCQGCPALKTEIGKYKCLIYNNRMESPSFFNGINIWANGCPKFPTAKDFREGYIPVECSYIYTETGTSDIEEKLNQWV